MVDNNTCHSIAAVAQIALFSTYASDWRILTAKITFVQTNYYISRES